MRGIYDVHWTLGIPPHLLERVGRIEVSWFERRAARIYFEEQGSGDPLLILPGFAESIEEFSDLRVALAARYRVVAADLPGSGKSGPQPRVYTPQFYEEDALSMIELLRFLETGPAHLLGHSDGGEVALLMAAWAPDVTRSVIAWGASGTLADADLSMLDAFHDLIDNPIPPLQQFSEYLKYVYGEDDARATVQSWTNAVRSISMSGGDISLSQASKIACPALIMGGEHDPLISPQLTEHLGSHIAGAETIIVQGAGHNPHSEQPEWFTRTILSWLERHRAA